MNSSEATVWWLTDRPQARACRTTCMARLRGGPFRHLTGTETGRRRLVPMAEDKFEVGDEQAEIVTRHADHVVDACPFHDLKSLAAHLEGGADEYADREAILSIAAELRLRAAVG